MQNKSITLDKQVVTYKDLGIIDYKSAWEYQEELLLYNTNVKAALAKAKIDAISESRHFIGQEALVNVSPEWANDEINLHGSMTTRHYFLLCEHPPVYTLGKSGHLTNILVSEDEMKEQNIQFYRTNRGGDITFHGPQQVVGYPIIDLEKFYTDIGRYLRDLEEVVILTLAGYGIKGERSKGETGVWIDPSTPGRERKICAMGVRCSRWVTMHGFALNVNTDLDYFKNIIPCGIQNKQVTSIEKELQHAVGIREVKEKLQQNFSKVFNVEIR